MNVALVRSPRALASAAVLLAVAVLLAWWPEPERPFAVAGRGAQVASGVVTLVLLVAVAGYAARKYAHRGRYSPEFLMRREFEALERAERRVRELRPRIAAGSLATRRAVESAAHAILREEGVHRVRRAIAEPGAPGEPPWKVRIAPTEPLRRARHWMHVHLLWGTAFGIAVFVHSRGAFDSAIAIALSVASALVWASGLWGLVAWMRGPLELTRAERDLSIEEAHALDQALSRKLEAALAALPEGDRRAAASVRAGADGAAVLDASKARDEERRALEDAVVLATQARLVAAEHGRLRRVRSAMMAWKLLHVPAAIVLGALVALHLWALWSY